MSQDIPVSYNQEKYYSKTDVRCPQCGLIQNFDISIYPKCSFCKYYSIVDAVYILDEKGLSYVYHFVSPPLMNPEEEINE